ncbi:conserved hypothetical protein [Tenacibaculum maritimum]|uniref:hypothetical protein n=1 Tax=Tenacibaculum maritimum TaxID=107401 RepID=UPI0012E4056C|nr:hypothetical protein [Tenacibaculum maritimum]CAA0150202.1 conserved hypothetical protein [Tenacibaculum maritimum]
MNKEQLLARAKELQVQVTEGARNTEISNLIKIAEHPILTKDLATAKNELEEQLAIANKEITSLKEKLAEATSTPEAVKGDTYENEEGIFEFTVTKFKFKGDKYTSADAVADKNLMESLIESNFIYLKKN